jgi:hypothetical protein
MNGFMILESGLQTYINVFRFALVAIAVTAVGGTLVTHLVRDVIWSRGRHQRRRFSSWFHQRLDGATLKHARLCERVNSDRVKRDQQHLDDFERSVVGGDRRIIWSFPPDEFVAQLQMAVNSTLSARAPSLSVLLVFAQEADTADLEVLLSRGQELKRPSDPQDAQVRVTEQVQRTLDALQADLERSWEKLGRLVTLVASVVLAAGGLLASIQEEDISAGVVLLVLAVAVGVAIAAGSLYATAARLALRFTERR